MGKQTMQWGATFDFLPVSQLTIGELSEIVGSEDRMITADCGSIATAVKQQQTGNTEAPTTSHILFPCESWVMAFCKLNHLSYCTLVQ